MRTHKILPITYQDYDYDPESFYYYYNVEFLEDFGNFKKGKYEVITVDAIEGVIEHSTVSDIEIIQKFKCTPIND